MAQIVVFDTNVLISALLSAKGNPFRCVALARLRAVESVTCQQILDEFEGKLLRKFIFSAAKARTAVEQVRELSRLVEITGSLVGVTPDQKDDKIVECAVVAGASHIVSGDRHLLQLRRYQGIAIVTPAEFLTVAATDERGKPTPGAS